jgi:three-Cys-motif partner protein
MVEWHEWIKGKLEVLLSRTKELEYTYPGEFYPVGAWAAVKLLALMNYLPVYTKIIPKHFPSMYYIEPLAGSGLCKVKERGDIIMGSPIIASIFSRQEFDGYLLIERDRKRAEFLKKCMESSARNVEVIEGDCNEQMSKLLEKIPSRSHYLAFIDCEGLDVNWDVMEKLLQKQGDILFTLQTGAFFRVKGKADKSRKDEEKLIRFFGGDEWRDCKSDEEIVGCYSDKLRKYREIVIPIPIKGKGNFRYSLLFALKKTKGGSPWIKAVEYIKEKVENCEYKYVLGILDLLTGRSKDITDYFPEREV